MDNILEANVFRLLRYRGYSWAFPQMSYGCWIADFIAWGKGKGILEVEIKRTWADYKNDYKKSATKNCLRGGYSFMNDVRIKKLSWLVDGKTNGKWRPNLFIYCAEPELAERIVNDSDLPKGFGVWKIDRKHLYSCDGVIKRPRRLYKLSDKEFDGFKEAAFKKSLHLMDKYWEFVGHKEGLNEELI